MDTSIYHAACESFQRATSTLEETLGAIESHLAVTAKNHRESLNSKSLLQVKLSQTETKLKVALDELSIQRSVRNDTTRLAERVTELQMENAKLAEKVTTFEDKVKELKKNIAQLSAELCGAKAENEAMKQVWKDAMRSYEAKIDALTAQAKPHHTQEANL